MIKTYKKRDFYLKKFLPYIGRDLIKVIVGQRRVGKSYMMYQLMDVIKRGDRNTDIIYPTTIRSSSYRWTRSRAEGATRAFNT